MFISSIMFLIVGLTLAVFTKQRKYGIVAITLLFLILLLFTLIYFIADNLTGDGFDESVLFHLQYGLGGAGLMDFLQLIIIFLLLIVASIFLSFSLYRLLKANKWNLKYLAWFRLLSSVLIGVAILMHPLSRDLLDTFSTSKSSKFSALYQPPMVEIVPDNPPNIVYIYLESLERTYMDEVLFPGLIKELRALEDSAISFTDISDTWGTGWTIAGMTASQCAIPLVSTGLGKNSMDGMNEFYPNAICLGDILKNQGFKLSYMGGAHLDFAGKGKFYSTHGFERVRGREELKGNLTNPNYLNSWGLYDDTLLDLAMEEFHSLSANKEHFGLFLLTLDTHHPQGYPTASCKNMAYKALNNSMLNAVACSDYLVAKFVRKIMDSDYAENTLIVIASDHLAMPNNASEILDFGKRRNLLMMLQKNNLQRLQVEKPGTTLDIAPTILGLLGYEGVKFGLGRDLLSEPPTLQEEEHDLGKLLSGYKDELRRFWQFPVFEAEFRIDIDKKTIEIGGETMQVPILLKIGKSKSLLTRKYREISGIYFEGMWGEVLNKKLFSFQEGDLFVWVDSCAKTRLLVTGSTDSENNKFCIFGGELGRVDYIDTELVGSSAFASSDVEKLSNSRFSSSLYEGQKQALTTGKAMNEASQQKYEGKSNDINLIRASTGMTNTPEEFLNLSLKYYQEGHYEQSIEAAETALSLRPDYVLAYNNICVANIRLEEFKKAMEACEKALELDPDFELAQNNLRWAKDESKVDSSIAAIKSYSKDTPESFLNLSLQYYEMGNYQKSIEAAETALSRRPDYVLAYNNICVANIKLEEFEKAMEACEKALELDPEYELVQNNLRWASNLNWAKSQLKKAE